MTSLYLIRHAQALGNIQHRFQGRTDTPLTPHGRQQALQLARRMQAIPIHAVYASPLQRAWETAAAIAKSHRMEVLRCDGVVELDGGAMEDVAFEELYRLYPEEMRLFLEEPQNFLGVGGGESFPEVFARMHRTILHLAHLHRGENFVVVSHGAAIRAFMCFALDRPLSQMGQLPWGGNTGVTHITFGKNLTPEVHNLFDISHLELEIVPPAQIKKPASATRAAAQPEKEPAL